eukprot:TRINITY_DN1080_c0_g3_i1.p1 TRINITY_DN1080_c0_g3~~TRINITY_DN1080_c0_g3_i1.p1  ORF type:complete len:208 (-),score=47.73 TRINITY_DN1080_c0_g3_i1:292-915(-)
MDLPKAHQSEILRATEKDIYWSTKFTKMMVDTIGFIMGPSFELKYGDKIKIASKCLYYSLSSLGGRTTGEEYTSLFERRSENKIIRTLSFLIQILIFDGEGWLSKIIDNRIYQILSSLHMAVFYLSSNNLNLQEARRFFSLTYIRPEVERNEEKPNYNILGILLFVKIGILAYDLIMSNLKKKESPPKVEKEVVEEKEEDDLLNEDN